MIYDIQDLVNDYKNALIERIKRLGSPRLDIVKTSNDYASERYIGNKVKMGELVGVKVRVIAPHEMHRSNAHGLIVQLPVGDGFNERDLISCVPNEKDVDGFNDQTLGEIMRKGYSYLSPCTAVGVTQIIHQFFNEKLAGKNIVIINRSNIVGKPLAMMLLGLDATVTICHSKTVDLIEHTKKADCVVSAVGKANFITREMLKEGALVVDVGINRNEAGKLCGDVSEDVKTASDVWTTPVPRGVGQLTVLNLLHNTLLAMIKQNKR